ncbi:coiled-coil domain-containing protein 124 isoform X1 [Rousettus aegyptiacus]|uniref:coiled-coil domain-containing protein 124 isoform X1 n=1 Tax=Rousettus aegyptiacus TaxID=9407 RepID=UPI000789A9CC|nr:coiled-coil domain-containing protein 124 isoform X1 [Rousettus aegyptiacus]
MLASLLCCSHYHTGWEPPVGPSCSQICSLCSAQCLAHSRASNPGAMVVGWDLLLTAPSSQEEKEKRRLEQLERKKETQRLLEEEDSKLKGGKAPRVAVPGKVTRAQIEETLRRDHQHKETPEPVEKAKSHLEVPLEENVNRRVLEEGSIEARTIEDAIAVLSVAEEAGDRHPERRMRAAFTAFEEAQLPRLKQENPNMRLSQLKQLLKKEWLRSPDNPMNQRAVPFNTPK